MHEPRSTKLQPLNLGEQLKEFFHDKPLFSAQAPIFFTLGRDITLLYDYTKITEPLKVLIFVLEGRHQHSVRGHSIHKTNAQKTAFFLTAIFQQLTGIY